MMRFFILLHNRKKCSGFLNINLQDDWFKRLFLFEIKHCRVGVTKMTISSMMVWILNK